jgi:hypothetical protein
VPEKTGQVAGFVVSRLLSGAPKGTRIPNLLVRSQMLYPIELSAHPREGILPQGGFRRKPGVEFGIRNSELGIPFTRQFHISDFGFRNSDLPHTQFATRAPRTPRDTFVIRIGSQKMAARTHMTERAGCDEAMNHW